MDKLYRRGQPVTPVSPSVELAGQYQEQRPPPFAPPEKQLPAGLNKGPYMFCLYPFGKVYPFGETGKCLLYPPAGTGFGQRFCKCFFYPFKALAIFMVHVIIISEKAVIAKEADGNSTV
jgi:hypothetical protein